MKKKIFWISQSPPISKSRDAGGQTFNYYFKEFMKRDDLFEISLIAHAVESEKKIIEKELSKIDHYIVYSSNSILEKFKKIKNIDSKFNPFSRYSNMISNYYASEIIRYSKKMKDEGIVPDVIIFEWTNVLLLAPKIKKIFPNVKMVASEHDVAFIGLERRQDYYKGIKKIYCQIRYSIEKRNELESLKLCSLVLPHNQENIETLIKEGIQENKIKWLVPYYDNLNRCVRLSNGRDILFFGAMVRPENYLSAIWFIEEVMPLLKNLPIRFVILGNRPPKELIDRESEKVHITGFVDNIVPYFEEAMCFVAPLVLGAGIKVKVLEALSSGCAVLTNNLGIEGIPAKNMKEYIHCETAKEYAEVIRSMYYNQNEYNIGEVSKKFVNDNFNLKESSENYMTRVYKL